MKDIAGAILYLLFLCAVIGGWIGNLVRLFGDGDSMGTGELIVRIAGILIFPIGVIMGWVP